VAAACVAAGLVLSGCGRIFGRTSSNPATTLPTLPPTTASTVPVVTTVPTPTEYRIARGDTMRRIAGRFNTTVEAILAVNPTIKDPNKIEAGQVILIPPPAAPAATTTTAPAAPPST
jgi:LysM repeat protein